MQSPVLRLLLLSEHPEDHRLLCDMLAQCSRLKREAREYQISWIADPAQAIVALHDTGLHLCLLDDHFAGDAAVFLRAVRGNHLPPLLVLASAELPAQDDTLLLAGAADYVVRSQMTPALLERLMYYVIQQHLVAEQALQEEEIHYRHMIAQSPDAIAIHRDGLLVYFNDACRRLFAIQDNGAYLGRSVLDFVLPDRRADIRRWLYESYRNGEVITPREERILRADGLGLDMEVTSTPIMYGGRPAAQIVLRDISARKQAEAALQQSEERYRLLVENAQDFIILADPDLNIQFANRAFYQGLGYDPEAFLPLNMLDLIHPDDRASVLRAVNQLNTSGRLSAEYRLRHVTGRWIHSLTNAVTLYDEQGSPRVYQAITRDISDLKRIEEAVRLSEALFRRTYDNAPVMMHTIDENGIILDVNRKWLEVMGYMQPEVIGQHITTVMTADSAAQAQQTLLPQFWQDGFSRDMECQFVMQDGTVIDVLLDSDAIFDMAGRRIGLTVLRDVTERKRIAAERERLIAELDAFAHTVAHDLKNPLQLVVGYTDLLKDEHPVMTVEEIGQYIHKVWRTGLKMRNIIEELLLLASVRQSEEIEIAPLDMGGVVHEAQQRLAYLIEEFGATISGPACWPQALGYGPWVEEIWANYISNAVKYGGTPPQIRLGADAPQGGMVRFWVADNGQGIPPEQQDRLFAAFTQVHQVRAQGHGLGLSIVRRIVARLGGEVGIESEVGAGSRFYFTLPEVGAVPGAPE